jgi:sec-independent protein translocase protein TatC
MSGAIPDDAARTLATGRATVGSMLSTAQTHLRKVFLVFVTGLLLTIWALRAFLWDQLKRDLVYNQMGFSTSQATDIIVLTPFDVILLQFKIGFIVGIILSLPVLVYLSRDELRRRGYWPDDTVPRWKIWSFALSILFLFAGGVAYAYLLFFPIMFEFLAANAVQAGFKPTWSIVKWTEFVFFLALSFGVAAQLPLFMSVTARAGIVPYETYRDKWRYAVVGIFVFGAMFSPPDPFTQIMWGVPLCALYFISLGVTKLAVLSKRAGEQVPMTAVVRDYWNMLAGTTFVTVVGVYAYLLEGGVPASNDLLESIGSRYRVAVFPEDLAVAGLDPTVTAILVGLLVSVPVTGVVLFYFRIQDLEQSLVAAENDTRTAPSTQPSTDDASAGEKAEIDLTAMSAPAIRAASIEAFVELGQERGIEYAEQAVENQNAEKAQAILDRLDELEDYDPDTDDDEEEEDDEENIVTSTAAGVVDPFTEEETTEDDIGGYYYDLRFILDSLTSRAIWIVATFMIVMAGSFMWLYLGGIGQVREVFFQNMPPSLVEEPQIVVLHPVEALIFMLKFSTILGFVSVIPLLLYFAWPAVKERGLSDGSQNIILYWGAIMFVALIGGTAFGFLYVAPTILSVLATDVVNNNMIIAYRISSFGWMVVYLTVGVGVLAMIPVTMVLFVHGNIVSYERMRTSWRVVVLAFFAAGGFLSPNGIWTMFIVAIPASLVYLLGLGLVWVYALGSNIPGQSGKPAD